LEFVFTVTIFRKVLGVIDADEIVQDCESGDDLSLGFKSILLGNY